MCGGIGVYARVYSLHHNIMSNEVCLLCEAENVFCMWLVPVFCLHMCLVIWYAVE